MKEEGKQLLIGSGSFRPFNISAHDPVGQLALWSITISARPC